MGMFDKAKDLAKDHGDKADGAIDKAAEVADDQVGDKVGSDKIRQGAEAAKDAVDKLADS